jgi:cold shock CspA family protein
MAQGEILWFDAVRGFGFIRPDMGPRDVFLHLSALGGRRPPEAGSRVEFELLQARDGKLIAQNVSPLDGGRPRARPASRRA